MISSFISPVRIFSCNNFTKFLSLSRNMSLPEGLSCTGEKTASTCSSGISLLIRRPLFVGDTYW